MAKEEAKNKPGKAAKKGGKGKIILMMIIAGAAMPFMLPTVLLFLAGFVPMYVAFATDSDPEKSGAMSVGAMNFAGLVPFLIDLWTKGQTLDNAIHILSDANVWFVILGASAVGQLVAYAVPSAIASLSFNNDEARIKTLRKNLELLKESWGAEVAAAKMPEKT